MPRRFLNQFGEREAVDCIFVIGEKQLRHNRNGNLYLQMRLSDRTATVNGMMWNAKETTATDIENGDYVRVEGTTQLFNGTMQIIATKLTKVDAREVNEEDYVQVSPAQIEALQMELTARLEELGNRWLRDLAQQFLSDEDLFSRFCKAPAAVKNHHAHHGGLLTHVVHLMRLSAAVAEHYDEVDNDLLLMGVFLHDIGKIDELEYERDLSYSDEGQLIGHLVMGVSILEEKIRQCESATETPFPNELALRLKHMIVSHHGKLEFGSPKIPMTPEALVLHYLDDLDAKLNAARQLVESDANKGQSWTPYNATFGRKIFKGQTESRPPT